MNRYFANRLFKVGFWMFVVGSGPLLAIIALAAIGLWPDPNPNPFGPGLLAFFTFWPSIICMIIGAIQARTRASVAADRSYMVMVLMKTFFSADGRVATSSWPSGPKGGGRLVFLSTAKGSCT